MSRRIYLLTAVALMMSLFAMASAVGAGHKKDHLEGCTPGYYKTHAVAGSDLSFEAVFGNTAVTSTTTTLMEAAALTGGGINALVRHAAAAYLNAINDTVVYPHDAATVVRLFQEALANNTIEWTKDVFAAANELGCPLN